MNNGLQRLLQPGDQVLHAASASALGRQALSGMLVLVTRQRLLIKTGLISRKVESRRVCDVVAVDVEQSLIARLLGYGTVTIRFGFPNMAPIELVDIADPQTLRAALLRPPH